MTGGIYFGTHNEAALDENGVETASDIRNLQPSEVERIAKFALKLLKSVKAR